MLTPELPVNGTGDSHLFLFVWLSPMRVISLPRDMYVISLFHS